MSPPTAGHKQKNDDGFQTRTCSIYKSSLSSLFGLVRQCKFIVRCTVQVQQDLNARRLWFFVAMFGSTRHRFCGVVTGRLRHFGFLVRFVVGVVRVSHDVAYRLSMSIIESPLNISLYLHSNHKLQIGARPRYSA